MNGAPSGGIQSSSPQAMVDQRPRFEGQRIFKKKLKRGRPANNQKQQHWVK